MSRSGQTPSGPPDVTTPAIRASTFPMASGDRFEWHVHERHQLAWAASGVLTVVAEAGTWVLPPARALWIPAGTAHETIASERSTMRTLYLEPGLSPIDWTGPRPLLATRLLAALIEHLSDDSLAGQSRGLAEALLFEVLEPVEVATIEVTIPEDERALRVARALIAQPSDQRSLAEWGREVGASVRTLTRAFVAGTGIPFTRWRTAVRLRAALPRLAAGEPVSVVARDIGYETPSAFVAAFRRETGVTPGTYFRAAQSR